jgi:hypothetical protein
MSSVWINGLVVGFSILGPDVMDSAPKLFLGYICISSSVEDTFVSCFKDCGRLCSLELLETTASYDISLSFGNYRVSQKFQVFFEHIGCSSRKAVSLRSPGGNRSITLEPKKVSNVNEIRGLFEEWLDRIE